MGNTGNDVLMYLYNMYAMDLMILALSVIHTYMYYIHRYRLTTHLVCLLILVHVLCSCMEWVLMILALSIILLDSLHTNYIVHT